MSLMTRDEGLRPGQREPGAKRPSTDLVQLSTDVTPGSTSLLRAAKGIIDRPTGSVVEDSTTRRRIAGLASRIKRLESRQIVEREPESILQELLNGGQEDEAKALIASVGDPIEKSGLLIQTARHFFAVGNAQAAEEVIKNVYKVAKGKKAEVRASIQIDLANSMVKIDREEEARLALKGAKKAAKELAKQSGFADEATSTLVAISKTYAKLSDPASAEDILTDAREIAIAIGTELRLTDRPDPESDRWLVEKRTAALLEVAKAYVEIGNTKEALQTIADSSDDPTLRKPAKEELMRTIVANPDIDQRTKTQIVTLWLTPDDALFSELLAVIESGRDNAQMLEPTTDDEVSAEPGMDIVLASDTSVALAGILPEDLSGKETLAGMITDLRERSNRFLAIATQHFLEGNFDEGKRVLEKVINAATNHFDRKTLGLARLVYHTMPENERVPYYGGRIAKELAEAGEFDIALRLIEELGISSPDDNYDPIKDLAEIYVKKGDIQGALEFMSSHFGPVEKGKKRHEAIGRELIKATDDPEELAGIEEFFLGLDYNDWEYLTSITMGSIYSAIINRSMELDELELALDCTKKLPADPHAPDAKSTYLQNITRAYIAKGEIATAIKLVEGKVEGVDVGGSGIKIEIANAAIEQGDFDTAKKFLDEVWAAYISFPNKSNQSKTTDVVRGLTKIGQHEEALSLLDEVEEYLLGKNGKPQLKYEIADELARLGKFDEAIDVIGNVGYADLRTKIYLRIAKESLRTGNHAPNFPDILNKAGISDELDLVELLVEIAEEENK